MLRYILARSALEAALKQPLPGPDAQWRLAPRPMRTWTPGVTSATARHAAGLLLLFPVDDLAHLVLTVRADTLERHGGQVSLPGGVVEPGESVEQTALREAHEEIGLNISAVKTLGALTPIDIHVSGFRLHPIVGTMDERPALFASDGEVARVLEIPIAALMNPRAFAWRTMARNGEEIRVPTLHAEGAEIWGATAMVVSEFLAMLGWNGPPSE
jgi:8-oxo-dGTP pyrophosphatase MutT (NUDIX family)